MVFYRKEYMKELWKDIKNFEGVYSVSNFGRIRGEIEYRGRKSGRIIKGYIRKDGYHTVLLKKRGFYVHILVAQAFIGDRPYKYEVNHKDGDKKNCRHDNLEYLTKSDNCIHAIKNHLMPHRRGESNGQSKLNPIQVLEIRNIYNQKNNSSYKLAKLYKVTPATIRDIIRRKSWPHI